MAASRKAAGQSLSVADIDRLIHQPARLSIMAHLSVVERADFLFLLRQTELTKGNMSSHLSKLERAGYVAVEKRFVGKMPKTLLSLTEEGRRAFRDYRRRMKRVLDRPPG
jgi:DNA-binding MarR family transcriptional regulator